jgi:hypothetical protein
MTYLGLNPSHSMGYNLFNCSIKKIKSPNINNPNIIHRINTIIIQGFTIVIYS